MRKLFISAITLFLIVSSCQKTDMMQNDPFDFAKEISITPKFELKSRTLSINIILKPIMHAYAEGEQIGKPVRLEILEKNGWAADGKPVIPQGINKKFGSTGESKVIEGSFLISQKLKKGSGPLNALLHLQVCTKNMCDRPRTHTITIDQKHFID